MTVTEAYRLYDEAVNLRKAILNSEYPHDRMIAAYRKATRRAARRHVILLAELDRIYYAYMPHGMSY